MQCHANGRLRHDEGGAHAGDLAPTVEGVVGHEQHLLEATPASSAAGIGATCGLKRASATEITLVEGDP